MKWLNKTELFFSDFFQYCPIKKKKRKHKILNLVFLREGKYSSHFQEDLNNQRNWFNQPWTINNLLWYVILFLFQDECHNPEQSRCLISMQHYVTLESFMYFSCCDIRAEQLSPSCSRALQRVSRLLTDWLRPVPVISDPPCRSSRDVSPPRWQDPSTDHPSTWESGVWTVLRSGLPLPCTPSLREASSRISSVSHWRPGLLTK